VGGKIFMSGKTSLIAVLVHAVVFFVLLSFRRQIPVVNVIFEGFEEPATEMEEEEEEGFEEMEMEMEEEEEEGFQGYESFADATKKPLPTKPKKKRKCVRCCNEKKTLTLMAQ
jgi:hypothetical protein